MHPQAKLRINTERLIRFPSASVGFQSTGNCWAKNKSDSDNLQGFDSDGVEVFWSVTGDIVSSLGLVDMNQDGMLGLLVRILQKPTSFGMRKSAVVASFTLGLDIACAF